MLFTVLISIAMLLGAGVMSVVLVGANAPNALAIGVILAANLVRLFEVIAIQ